MPKNVSAYLVAMPSGAIAAIQNAAPGPPIAMAVATPAILPLPIVAAIAVVSAWNGEISPGAGVVGSRRSAPRMTRRDARRNCRNWMPRLYKVMTMPSTTSSAIVQRPQTRLVRLAMSSASINSAVFVPAGHCYARHSAALPHHSRRPTRRREDAPAVAGRLTRPQGRAYPER